MAIVWASFGFRYTAFAAATTGTDAFLGQMQDAGVVGRVLSAARRFHLLPEAYIYGSSLTVQFASERAAFLNGRFGTSGWWWYFPYAFAVKTTIPALLLGVLALAASSALETGAKADGADPARAGLYAATPLLALIALYWAVRARHASSTSATGICCRSTRRCASWPAARRSGSEPLFPRTRNRNRRRDASAAQQRSAQPAVAGPASSAGATAIGVATLALLAWHVAESVTIRPDYLAYFNQLAGGPSRGLQHLADSSLDWGQDLPGTEAVARRRGAAAPGASAVYLSYFGTARPEYYGIQATPLAGFIDRRPPQPPVPLGGGVYCISATVLDVDRPLVLQAGVREQLPGGVQER